MREILLLLFITGQRRLQTTCNRATEQAWASPCCRESIPVFFLPVRGNWYVLLAKAKPQPTRHFCCVCSTTLITPSGQGEEGHCPALRGRRRPPPFTRRRGRHPSAGIVLTSPFLFFLALLSLLTLCGPPLFRLLRAFPRPIVTDALGRAPPAGQAHTGGPPLWGQGPLPLPLSRGGLGPGGQTAAAAAISVQGAHFFVFFLLGRTGPSAAAGRILLSPFFFPGRAAATSCLREAFFLQRKKKSAAAAATAVAEFR